MFKRDTFTHLFQKMKHSDDYSECGLKKVFQFLKNVDLRSC